MTSSEIDDEALVRAFPGEPITHDNAAHYRGRLRHELVISKCQDCDEWHHPPKPVCPQCWSTRVVPTSVSGSGTIFMVIFLNQGPPADGVDYSTPYPVASIDLADAPGVRFTSTVVGGTNDEVVIGAAVELDWIERNGSPMPVFRLTRSEAAK
ncbi:hypothetical protein A0W34_30085 (plasmid) [Rhodococcus sp. BH4]|nr:hypothetical protein A0W34_30085 [Rhodococcus sp. BH4]